MKKITLLIIMALLSFTVSSCKFNHDPYDSVESGDFIYATNVNTFHGNEGEISIIGLTDQGQQKEVLIFPSTIDGYKVVSIGALYGWGKSRYSIKIYNAKKVYFTKFLKHTNVFNTQVYYETENKLEIFVAGVLRELSGNFVKLADTRSDPNTIMYFEQDFVNKIYTGYKNSYTIKTANLTYYSEKNTCYFVDFVNNTTVSVIPPNPHKDGYKFEGWYKDITFKERWNFNKDIVPAYKIEYDENNIPTRKDTKLYANWVKSTTII